MTIQTLTDPILAFKQELAELPASKRLSRQDAEALYSMGYQLTMQNRMEQAYNYFTLLVLYVPTNIKYLNGLGLSCKLVQRYEQAFRIFSFMCILEPMQPQHVLSLAEVQLLQGQTAASCESLKLVVAFCAENIEFQTVGKRAQAMLELIGSAQQQVEASA